MPISNERPSLSRDRNPIKFFFWFLIILAIVGVSLAFVRLINQQQQLKTQIAGLENGLSKNDDHATVKPSVTVSPISSPTATPVAIITPLSPGTAWASSPSRPSQLHSVAKGETLFAISQKYNLDWTNIVAANGLIDANLIKAGDTLVIPTVDAKAGINQVDFMIDTDKAKTIQAKVTVGQDSWRKDPLEVAKREGSGLYGLTVNDQWVVGNQSLDAGEALVRIASASASAERDGKNDKQYEVKLSQPAEKGEQGIWAITVVKVVK